jgi:sodium-dependent dicarboxylate transporter 2/3/5
MSHKTFGFVLGPVLFIAILSLPPFDSFHATAQRLVTDGQFSLDPTEIVYSMQIVFALLALMVVWWLTEAIPLPATALLPAVVLPWFHIVGVREDTVIGLTLRNVLVNYASPVIFLFLGGFLLAAAMQKWKLDRRFTLWLLTRGTLANDSRKILLGIMIVTSFLSMWISNTATAAMMLPLGLGILTLMGGTPGKSRFGTALMLGIAWSASIGGIGTIIGSPPNGIALGILNSTFDGDPAYHRITFLDWMKFGVPYVVLFLPVVWFVLLKIFPPEVYAIPGGREKLLNERSMLGSLSAGERGTIIVFLIAVVCWISNPFWQVLFPSLVAERVSWVNEYSIGLLAGLLLFVTPVRFSHGEFVLTWRDTKFVDWGTLLLFGGGIALSDAMFKTGVASWIATSVVGFLGAPSMLVMMFAVVLLVDLMTEVTSNTAVTSMIVPIVISIAITTGANPVTLAVAAALAASMAFMLPVATPPNAIVFSSGYVRLGDMIKAGVILDILGWLFTVGIIALFASWIFGVLSL